MTSSKLIALIRGRFGQTGERASKRRAADKYDRSLMRGLTLTELMISMVLGLVVVGGVMQVFLTTQETYQMREAVSRVQESGRLAVSIISQEARQAGYSGCASGEITNFLDPDGDGYDEALHGFESAFRGFPEANVPEWLEHHVRGDALVVVNAAGAAGNSVTVENMDQPGDSHIIHLPDGTEFESPQGTIIFISNCQGEGGDVFQDGSQAAKTINRHHGQNISPGNKHGSHHWSRDYSGTFEIMTVGIMAYYIGESDAGDGTTSLRHINMAVADPVDIELVDGIHDMRLEFGLDTNGDGQINTFTNAAGVADWREAAAVRVHLLGYSSGADLVVDEPQTLQFAGANFTAPDRRMYQVFTTSVAARNLLQ